MVLDVRGLELHYATPRGDVRAVEGVSFSVASPGQATGIIGETGSGKTSLLLALTRMLPRNVSRYAGEVFFEGRDLMKLSAESFRREVRWKKIAVVFQGAMNGFNPVLRIGDQIAERPLAERGAKVKEVRRAVEDLLQNVGLPRSISTRYPHELSGGMKQRAAIAMALAMRPPLLILDEPTSALDVSVQAQIMNVLKKLKWDLGISMVFITHDIALASDLCDRIAVMYAGEIREEGSAEQVLGNPRDPYTQELLASIPRLRGGERPRFVSGATPDPTLPSPGCRFHARCPRAFQPCANVPPPLIDMGNGHTARCWLYHPRWDGGSAAPATATPGALHSDFQEGNP
jgi:oligopeptide/dipeptide ABC transporter ATP-binding protein